MAGHKVALLGRRARAIAWAVAFVLASSAALHAEVCERAAFEAVVDEASTTLVKLTQSNTPVFQNKLRTLKDKRRWTHDQFLKDGAVFVRDEKIAEYDEKSEQLLIKINTQGGASSNCQVLQELRGTMKALVDTQNAKWAYMFDKIDRELAK
jgi:hypothetical protein